MRLRTGALLVLLGSVIMIGSVILTAIMIVGTPIPTEEMPRMKVMGKDTAPPELYVEFGPEVRDFLAKEWDKLATNPNQVERGYCVLYENQVDEDDDNQEFYYVTHIAIARTFGMSTPVSTIFTCPQGTATLHTHPPTTCTKVWDFLGIVFWDPHSCKLGGSLAYQCQPSPTDKETLQHDWIRKRRPFAVIQCERNSLVPYFPK